MAALLVIFASLLIVALALFLHHLRSLEHSSAAESGRQMSEVWHNYPFKSHYAYVKESFLHYIDEGDPEWPAYLFLHGNPTSSYLWRLVVPTVSASGARAIAVDNIGFGASGHPEINYSFDEQVAYIEALVDELALKEITLVLHDWGGAIGFEYANRHRDNVAAIIFLESLIHPLNYADLPNIQPLFLKALRTPGLGEIMVLALNLFVTQMIPQNVSRKLSSEEMASYREPFPSFASRYPMLAWPKQIPIDGSPVSVAKQFDAFNEYISNSAIPKLLLYFEPGVILQKEKIQEMESSWQNLQSKSIGKGLHYVQEDYGPEIGQAIVDWSRSSRAHD